MIIETGLGICVVMALLLWALVGAQKGRSRDPGESVELSVKGTGRMGVVAARDIVAQMGNGGNE